MSIITFVSVIWKKIFGKKLSLFIIIWVVAKFLKDIVPVVPILVITSISLKLDRLSTIPLYEVSRAENVRKL